MSKRTPKFCVFPDAAGQWRWHLVGANSLVVCCGEGHPTKAKAVRAAEGVKRLATEANVEVDEQATPAEKPMAKRAKPAAKPMAKRAAPAGKPAVKRVPAKTVGKPSRK